MHVAAFTRLLWKQYTYRINLLKMKNIIVLAVLALIVSTSCRKKLDTVANIYIKDENNASVSNAMVVLYGTNTQGTPQQVAVFDTAYTNLNGMATFNYNDLYQLGQAGVAVLNIDATKDGSTGQGIIKVEQEETSEETVFIQ